MNVRQYAKISEILDDLYRLCIVECDHCDNMTILNTTTNTYAKNKAWTQCTHCVDAFVCNKHKGKEEEGWNLSDMICPGCIEAGPISE